MEHKGRKVPTYENSLDNKVGQKATVRNTSYAAH